MAVYRPTAHAAGKVIKLLARMTAWLVSVFVTTAAQPKISAVANRDWLQISSLK
jgi:hypothetical protein